MWIFSGLLMNLSYLDFSMHIKASRTAYNLQKAVETSRLCVYLTNDCFMDFMVILV